ncbi:DUF3667 domain-containing protein [bacterium]|nr:DUF3667 domain-containing protein [bacterium]
MIEETEETDHLSELPLGEEPEAPKADETGTESQSSHPCLDCGFVLEWERFCPNCGQATPIRRLTLREFLYETLANFFAFDGRWWLTVQTLVLRPGKLAREYVDGRRTRYAPPLRVFLWSVILALLLDDSRFVVSPANEGAQGFMEGMQGDSLDPSLETDTLDLPSHAMANPTLDPMSGLKRLGKEASWWNQRSYVFFQNLQKQGGDGFSQFIKRNLVPMLLLFVPFLALWLKLLYWRHPIYFLEHSTFVFYAHSLLFLALCIAEIVHRLSGWDGAELFFFLYLGHLYLSFRGFYGQSWGRSAVKMVLSSVGFVVLVVLFFIGGLIASAISMSL